MSRTPEDYIDAYDDGYKNGRDDRTQEVIIRIRDLFADGKISGDVCDVVTSVITDKSADSYINQIYDMGYRRGFKVALEMFIRSFEEMDACEYTMYTLKHIRQKIGEAYESLVRNNERNS